MPEPEKWYLNLAPSYGTKIKPRSGTTIKLAAKPSRAVRNSRSPEVDWTVSYAGSPDAHADYVVAPAFKVARTGLVEDHFRAELDIPVVNGRTYTITAKRTGNNAQVFTKQYVTWQRIYYTVHYMNTACHDAFKAIKDDLHRMFEAVNIELKLRETKQCRKRGRDVNEEFTSREADVRLPHTWDAADAPLARQPNHIRMVITRDLTDKNNGQIEWTMTNQTIAHADRKIRVSSTGPNHSTVVYENEVATFDRTHPFSRLEAYVKLDPVALPAACVTHDDAAHPHLGLKVDLSLDPSVAAVLHHYQHGTGLSFSGSVDCRRCDAGWEYAYSHATQATVGLANDERNPVTVNGSARVWIAANTVVINDPRMILDERTFAQAIRIQYGATTVNLADATAARTNENRVTIDFSAQAAVIAHLGGDAATIQISLYRGGALASGDVIGLLETVDFSVEGINANHNASHNDVSVSYKNNEGSRSFTVSSSKLLFVNRAALTGNFVHLTVPVEVPQAAITGSSPHHAEINLAHPSLAAVPTLAALATAMQAGRSLSFKATLNGRESLGGYSPTSYRWFIALNTRLMPGETQADVRRRLKLTIAHELGHSLNLVVKKSKNLTTDTDVDNTRWYTDDHGGTGPHCHDNAHLVPAGAAHGRPDTKSGQIYKHNPHAGGKLCVMYHALDHANMADQFCVHCLAHLKRGVANFGTP